jgi:hypothetical protein
MKMQTERGLKYLLRIGISACLLAAVVSSTGLERADAYQCSRGYIQDCVTPTGWVNGNCSTSATTARSVNVLAGAVFLIQIDMRTNFSSPCYSAWSRVTNASVPTSATYAWVNGYSPTGAPADTSNTPTSGQPTQACFLCLYSLMIRDCCGGFTARAWGSAMFEGRLYYTSTNSA